MKSLNFLLKGLFFLLFICCFFNCTSDDGFDSRLEVERDSISVENIEKEYSIDVLVNSSWLAETNVDWIKLDEKEGDKGRFEYRFLVKKNESKDDREGYIQFTLDNNKEYLIRILQDAGGGLNIYAKPDGSGSGHSWDEATNLSNALKLVDEGGTIHLTEGTFVPDVNDSFGGEITFGVPKNIHIVGGYPSKSENPESNPKKYVTLLSGNHESNHVMMISATKKKDLSVSITGVTISDGRAPNSSETVKVNGLEFMTGRGAGIIIGNSNVILDNIDVVKNTSHHQAGGVFAFDNSEVLIIDSRINENKADHQAGGLYAEESNIVIRNSEISKNEGLTAGAIHGYPNSKIDVYNSVISYNQAHDYGAAYYLRQGSKGIIVNTVIHGNKSDSNKGGGGILLYNNNNIDLISSTIINNDIEGPGGGIYAESGLNKANIYNSVIAGNKQSSDSDVEGAGSDALETIIISNIIGNKIYDSNSELVADIEFDLNSMFNEEKFYPIDNEDNPILSHSIEIELLMEVGESLNIDKDILKKDFYDNSRLKSNAMGAIIKEP